MIHRTFRNHARFNYTPDPLSVDGGSALCTTMLGTEAIAIDPCASAISAGVTVPEDTELPPVALVVVADSGESAGEALICDCRSRRSAA
jgi:hypothetical protein